MDRLSVAEAFEKWGKDLMGYATVLVGVDEAEDVVADTFAGLLRSRGWVAADDQRGYLFGAVLNSARMHHRSMGRRRLRERRAGGSSGWVAAPEPSLLSELAGLSPRHRAVIYLTYWEDLAPATIAEMLGVSDGSVRRHLARARQHLRSVLDAD